MCSAICYEYPLNERIRTYLRLARLLERLGTLIQKESSIDHHYALATLFEVMEVCSRADMKSDVLKDLERQKQQFLSYRENPAVEVNALNAVLDEIDSSFHALNTQAGRAGQNLSENDWLMAIRSRINIPGGTCEFDLPSYFAWQHRPHEERQVHLNQWAALFTPFSTAIQLLLRLLRQSGSTQKVIARTGQYQQNLVQQGRGFQLLRLKLDAANLVPEMSANRLLISIRFVHTTTDTRAAIVPEDIAFDLSLCP